MRILAIDPGPSESAYVVFDGATGRPAVWEKVPNVELLDAFRSLHRPLLAPTVLQTGFRPLDVLAVEMIASYGMAVGAEVFDTCVWIGRFVEAWGGDFRLIPRPDVKLHICGQRRAKDANIRQAIIDRYGPGKAAAVGLKASPGPLYGITGDCWSALAVAITAAELPEAS